MPVLTFSANVEALSAGKASPGLKVEASPAASPPKQRSMLIDVVRGIAISLVVLGHTDQGLLHRHWWGASPVGQRLNDAIYTFHMPAFFFVSGIFLCAGVDKRGMARYASEKLRTMIYPYLLWAVIDQTALLLFSRYTVQGTVTWPVFFANLVTGNASWFLPTLFVAIMVGMLLRRVAMPLLFLLAVLAQMFMPQAGASDIDSMFRDLPFLVLGMWVGRAYERFEGVSRSVSAVAAGLLALVVAWVPALLSFRRASLVVPLGVLGTVMLLFLGRALGRSAVARGFAWAGEASFGIFLISAFAQGGGRELLRQVFQTIAPWPQLIVPSVLAVVIPAWIYQHRVRLRIGWLFVWPFASKRTAVARQTASA